MGTRPLLAGLVAGAAALAGLAPAAPAADPGRWTLSKARPVPIAYSQGLTAVGSNAFSFASNQVIFRTDRAFRQTRENTAILPADVVSAEGYDHIGDPTWNPAEGGRLILPLECYRPWTGNHCATGAFGVADPNTLAFRYYVNLDPAEIPKAMWAETSPDGALIWTSSGRDLLAYRTSDVTPGRSGPIRSVRRLRGAVPPTGVTGAVFEGERLLLAGESQGVYQVWSVNTTTGERHLALETSICGEAEGLDMIRTLGGELHWLIAPFDPGCTLTYGPGSALLHYARRPGIAGLQVTVTRASAALPGPVTVSAVVRFRGTPIRGAAVSFAGARARTDARGQATVTTRLDQPGRFRVLAKGGIRFGLSDFVNLGVGPPVAGR